MDVLVSYNKYGFLGNEFLTWAWYQVENKEINLKDHEHVILEIGNKVILEKENGETITIKEGESLEEGKLALQKGAVVSELAFVYKSGEHEWRFIIKGKSFDICSLKTPITESVKKEDEYEGAVLEKHYLYNKVVDFLDKLFKQFMEIRLSDEWENEVSEISEWI